MKFITKDGYIETQEKGITWLGETANSVRSIFNKMTIPDIEDTLQSPLLQAKNIIIDIK